MLISGYPVGTKVQWDDSGKGYRTGIVQARYYNPGEYEIDGEPIEVNVIENSPQYAVKDTKQDHVIVMSHTKIFKQV